MACCAKCLSHACRFNPGDLYSLTAIYKPEVQRLATEWARAWCVPEDTPVAVPQGLPATRCVSAVRSPLLSHQLC